MFKGRANRFCEINRALDLRILQDQSEEIVGSTYLRLEIHLEMDGAEKRLIGTAKNKQGQVVTSLEAALFPGKHP